MNVAEQTIINLFEVQCCPIEDIQQSLDIPLPFVLDVLERKSPKYKAILRMKAEGTYGAEQDLSVSSADNSNGVVLDPAAEDIPDAKFARIREEAFHLALDPESSPFIKSSMLKFLWNKKRPEGVAPININVKNINMALERAREIRKVKLAKTEETSTLDV